MVEEIYKTFEKKRAEILRQAEFREGELTKEKEKEILKKAISERISQVQPPPSFQQKVAVRTAKQIKAQPKERQIKLLSDLVFEKGLSHALEVVRHIDSPYLLDEFHDALVDELYNKLLESGKLKAI